jgi:hypothetical protein
MWLLRGLAAAPASKDVQLSLCLGKVGGGWFHWPVLDVRRAADLMTIGVVRFDISQLHPTYFQNNCDPLPERIKFAPSIKSVRALPPLQELCLGSHTLSDAPSEEIDHPSNGMPTLPAAQCPLSYRELRPMIVSQMIDTG